jgi:hypothetical protein
MDDITAGTTRPKNRLFMGMVVSGWPAKPFTPASPGISSEPELIRLLFAPVFYSPLCLNQTQAFFCRATFTWHRKDSHILNCLIKTVPKLPIVLRDISLQVILFDS